MSTGIYCTGGSFIQLRVDRNNLELLLLSKDSLKVEQDLRAGKALRVHPTQQPSLLVEVVGDRTLQGPSLIATRVFHPLITYLGTFQVLLGPGALGNGTLAFL